ncbi:MAG: hypothetical protein IK093_04860 [Ruminiclostridium sp.]|nr:hypothetical protein [Ruminiclostridium sp.]
MKTIEEFIRAIGESGTLRKELEEVKDMNALAEFLKKHDVDGTAEDFDKAMTDIGNEEGELDDDEAEAAAGGFKFGLPWHP